MAFMGDAELGIAAADDQGGDAVARLPAAHAGAAGGDFAGHFEAGNIGRALGRRIEPEALHHVGAVHAGGCDLHQDFTFAGRRHRPLLRRQHLRASGSRDHDGGHVGGNGAHGSLSAAWHSKVERLFSACSRKVADFSDQSLRHARPMLPKSCRLFGPEPAPRKTPARM
jgi:hypothetical protein